MSRSPISQRSNRTSLVNPIHNHQSTNRNEESVDVLIRSAVRDNDFYQENESQSLHRGRSHSRTSDEDQVFQKNWFSSNY